jgi:hypothetical protein
LHGRPAVYRGLPPTANKDLRLTADARGLGLASS